MSASDFGEFRSVLEAGASWSVFRKVQKLIGEEGVLGEDLLEYLVSHFQHWSADIARVPMSEWLERAAQGEDVPALMLCNYAHMRMASRGWVLSERAVAIATLRVLFEPGLLEWLSGQKDCLRLNTLTIRDRKLDADALGHLARWPGLAHVSALELSSNRIGNDGLEALAASPHLGKLEKLCLLNNKITGSGVEAFAKIARFGSLRELDLRYNSIGKKGAEAIASAPFASKLEWLNLCKRDAPSSGFEALQKSTLLSEAIRGYMGALQ